MRQLTPFTVPGSNFSALNWFFETLELDMERIFDGAPTMQFTVPPPKKSNFRGPDGDVEVYTITVMGYQAKAAPPILVELPIERPKTAWEPLGPVMKFELSELRGGARVRARYDERYRLVQSLFGIFVTARIEKQYPTVGPLWQEHQAQLDAQQIELVDKHMQAQFGDAGIVLGADTAAPEGEPRTEGDDTKARSVVSDKLGTKRGESPARLERYDGLRRLFAEGLTQEEAAERLDISVTTVKRDSARLKLGQWRVTRK